MIQKGHWAGSYTFDNQVHNRVRGFVQTNFAIEILSVNNSNFSGKVQDDLSTGGTEGIGEISGKVEGNNIEFVKQMPVMTLLVGKKEKGKRSIKNTEKFIIQVGFLTIGNL